MSALLLLTLPATRIAYVLLALLIGGESAGIPLPGETALITGSILASQGKLWLPLVIAVAAAAAIVGDNIGYELGRHGARRLLSRPGRFEERRQAFLERGEAFFARHGGKTVLPRALVALPPGHCSLACRREPHALAAVLRVERARGHLVGDLGRRLRVPRGRPRGPDPPRRWLRRACADLAGRWSAWRSGTSSEGCAKASACGGSTRPARRSSPGSGTTTRRTRSASGTRACG